ncbi:MAG: hypothetical protein UT05_C0008G0041 [Parcubacteria group bacterium GW2011_GWF2_38_76]|nr:MAG: hypothetical protein UT05_C0008G0041 [Parcubacteria group bacterium GW2011_GWF2_38_76]HBM45704.1 hypothetical protein [Patescibacteria group bacterium]
MLKNSFIVFATILCLVSGTVANAYVASSTNFIIESDVISYTGGLSTSTNFSVQDSISDGLIGEGNSTSYTIDAGPLPMRESTLSVSVPADLILTGTITSLRGGTAEGSVSVTVITDNPGGYQLKLSGTSLSSGSNSFDSFSGPASWSVADGTSAFGFSTDSSTWNGIDSTARVVVTENSNNQPSGTATIINFKAESKKINQAQPAGSYSSSITLTALPL